MSSRVSVSGPPCGQFEANAFQPMKCRTCRHPVTAHTDSQAQSASASASLTTPSPLVSPAPSVSVSVSVSSTVTSTAAISGSLTQSTSDPPSSGQRVVGSSVNTQPNVTSPPARPAPPVTSTPSSTVGSNNIAIGGYSAGTSAPSPSLPVGPPLPTPPPRFGTGPSGTPSASAPTPSPHFGAPPSSSSPSISPSSAVPVPSKSQSNVQPSSVGVTSQSMGSPSSTVQDLIQSAQVVPVSSTPVSSAAVPSATAQSQSRNVVIWIDSAFLEWSEDWIASFEKVGLQVVPIPADNTLDSPNNVSLLTHLQQTKDGYTTPTSSYAMPAGDRVCAIITNLVRNGSNTAGWDLLESVKRRYPHIMRCVSSLKASHGDSRLIDYLKSIGAVLLMPNQQNELAKRILQHSREITNRLPAVSVQPDPKPSSAHTTDSSSSSSSASAPGVPVLSSPLASGPMLTGMTLSQVLVTRAGFIHNCNFEGWLELCKKLQLFDSHSNNSSTPEEDWHQCLRVIVAADAKLFEQMQVNERALTEQTRAFTEFTHQIKLEQLRAKELHNTQLSEKQRQLEQKMIEAKVKLERELATKVQEQVNTKLEAEKKRLEDEIRQRLKEEEFAFPLAFNAPAILPDSAYERQEIQRNEMEFELLNSFLNVNIPLNVNKYCNYGLVNKTHPHSLELVGAQRIFNVRLWKRFCLQRRKIREINGGSVEQAPSSQYLRTHPFLTTFNGEMLDATTNECWLFHATNVAALEILLRDGYDHRVGKTCGWFSAGMYFSDDPAKCNQYLPCPQCGRNFVFNNDHCKCTNQETIEFSLILYRVVLGDVHIVDKYDEDKYRGGKYSPVLRPPLKVGTQVPHDSVMAERGPSKFFHREIILYEQDRAYPEFVLRFRRCPNKNAKPPTKLDSFWNFVKTQLQQKQY